MADDRNDIAFEKYFKENQYLDYPILLGYKKLKEGIYCKFCYGQVLLLNKEMENYIIQSIITNVRTKELICWRSIKFSNIEELWEQEYQVLKHTITKSQIVSIEKIKSWLL